MTTPADEGIRAARNEDRSRNALRSIRLSNINNAITALRAASLSLKLAQEQTNRLGFSTTDCADYARQIDALLSSDGGECGLENLATLYATYS